MRESIEQLWRAVLLLRGNKNVDTDFLIENEEKEQAK